MNFPISLLNYPHKLALLPETATQWGNLRSILLIPDLFPVQKVLHLYDFILRTGDDIGEV